MCWNLLPILMWLSVLKQSVQLPHFIPYSTYSARFQGSFLWLYTRSGMEIIFAKVWAQTRQLLNGHIGGQIQSGGQWVCDWRSLNQSPRMSSLEWLAMSLADCDVQLARWGQRNSCWRPSTPQWTFQSSKKSTLRAASKTNSPLRNSGQP